MQAPTRSMSRTWSFVAAATVASALAGGWALTARAHGGMGPMAPMAAHGAMMDGPAGMMPGPWHGRMLERLLDGVDATAEQRTQIRAIAAAAAADLQAQREAGRSLRQEGLQLFAQPTLDAAAAEAQRQKMLQHHDAVSRRTMQAMLDIGRVLTPEQRAKVAERATQRRELMERHWRERRQLDSAPRS